MTVSFSPLSHNTIAHEIKGNNNPPSSSVRRTSKRKKVGKSHVSKVAFERKMQQLSQGFNPIAFVPGKVLDFSRYEDLLKKLGLWDFANVEFDRNIRVDLIGKLIVNYMPKVRRSSVDDVKISVSRADLARALKLPLPKKIECDVESFPADFLCFLEEFVSNWMLLHEDIWCTPTEIVNWMKLIREGNPPKVDWAGLVWFMVEKELAQRASLKDCYYASHLQQLIKVQKEELFREIPNVDLEKSIVEVEMSKEAVAVEDDEDDSDVKMMDFEESGNARQKVEEQNVELRLGQECYAQVENAGDADKVEKDSDCHVDELKEVEDVDKEEGVDDIQNSVSIDEVDNVENTESAEHGYNAESPMEENKDLQMMDFRDYKVEEQGQEQWLLDGKVGGQHFIQRCSMAEVTVSEDRRLEGIGDDVEHEDIENIEDSGHVEGFKILPKGPLDGMASANLMQAFETGQLPYSSNEFGGQSSLELMSSRPENNMILGGPSMFNHTVKREIDHEQDISHHGLNDNHKRMRVDGSWDNKSSQFDICIEQIQHWNEKAKICHMAAMDDTYQQARMSQHIFQQQLAVKDNEIEQLTYKLHDLQSKQVEIDRLDRELYLMSSVIDGYRKALKQSQRTFADYRKRCQVPDEPIYRDAGLGGVVKSVMELERERLKQEEENKMMRNFIEEAFRKTLNDCEAKWDGEVLAKVQSHHSRLVAAVKEMGLFKDHLIKHTTTANVQSEPQSPVEG